MDRGNVRKAIEHYLKALRIKPDYGNAHNNLGYALNLGHATENDDLHDVE